MGQQGEPIFLGGFDFWLRCLEYDEMPKKSAAKFVRLRFFFGRFRRPEDDSRKILPTRMNILKQTFCF